MSEIDLRPTEEMAANAERGLALREKHGRGGTEVGVARARDIKNRKNLSPETVRRMHSYFARHEVDKKGEGWGVDSAGYIAWLLWGGDAGQAWVDRKIKQLDDKQENARMERADQLAEMLMKPVTNANAKELARAVNEAIALAKRNGDDDLLELAEEVGHEIMAMKSRASRPGAKAEMMYTRPPRPKRLLPNKESQAKAYAEDIAQLRTHIKGKAGADAVEVLLKKAEKQLAVLNIPVAGDLYADAVRAAYAHGIFKGFRPGAKAKFDEHWRPEYEQRAADRINIAHNLMSKCEDKQREIAKTVKALEKAINDMRNAVRRKDSTLLYDTEDKISDLDRVRSSFTRPGAKATMAAHWTERVEVVEDVSFRNKNTGATVSGGGAVPWRSSGDRANWEAITHYSLMDTRTGTTAGKQYRTRQEAERALADAKAQRIRDERRAEREASSPDARRRAAIIKEIDRLMATGMTQIEALQYLKSRGLRIASSRPGAKATMAANESRRIDPIMQDAVLYKMDKLVELINAVRTYIKRDEPFKAHSALKGLIQSAQSADVHMQAFVLPRNQNRNARPGAKFANSVREGEKVSASDDAVSRKIRKLMKEGKPQDQAVAIALDMKRREEL